MSDQQTAERALPYLINDADEHSTPSFSAYERYIDPDKKDMAIRIERTDDGRRGACSTTGGPRASRSRTSRSSVRTSSSPRSA